MKKQRSGPYGSESKAQHCAEGAPAPSFAPSGRRCLAVGHGRGLHEKAEVDEGAGEGAGGFFVVFFNDLQCFC